MGSIMGSVSMQSQASSRGERLSAFVDGELFGEEHLNTFVSELDGEDRAAWSCYHLIGDALRSDDLAVSPAASSAARSADPAGRTMRGAPPFLPSMPASRPKSLPQCAGADAVRWPRRAVTWLHQGGKAGGPCGKARGLSSSSARAYTGRLK